jgi:diguanylate cyclase (GGDEF)-like protein/PAS domain S-box-containing protein
MAWQSAHYLALVVIASGFALVTALRIWQKRAAPGAIYLALQLLAIAEWTVSIALESSAAGIPAKLVWAKAEYVGLGSSPVLLLMFAWAYHERSNRLPFRLAGLVSLPQVIVVLAAWTNEWHGLIWSSLTMVGGEENVLSYGHGPVFFAGVAYSSLLYLAAAIVLAQAVWWAQSVHRARAATMVISSFAPSWLASTIYVVFPSWVGNVEIAPLGFILTAGLLNWSLPRYRLFDLVPVAQDILIEYMSDGLLVLDERGRIVSVNPAAQTMLWSDDASRVGETASTALARYPTLVAWLGAATEAQAELHLDMAVPRYIDARITELHGRDGRSVGRMVVLRDVTERVRAAEELRIREARYRGLYRAVPAGVIVRDATGALVDANERALDMLGVTVEQLAGTAPLDSGWQIRSDNGDVLSSLAVVSTAGQSSDGRVREMALRVTNPSGEVRWLLESAVSVVESNGGNARGSIVTLVDVTELKLQEQRLAYQAGHDELTGLPNFRTLEGALDRAVVAARRGRHSALAYIDLDRFKVVNDTLGHLIGDQALTHTVRLLRGKLRENDLLTRVGGDEFVALLDGVDLATGRDIAERLRQEIEECPFVSNGRSFPLSLSIGLAPIDGELSSSAALVRADTAMYAAKARSRNRVVVADSTDDSPLPAELDGVQAI